MPHPRLSHLGETSKYDQWIPSTIVLDPEALQRIFRCNYDGVNVHTFDSFVDEIKYSERASELLESCMRKWLGDEEPPEQGALSNRRLTQRARARLFTKSEFHMLIPGSRSRDIIMQGAQVKAYFWDFHPCQDGSSNEPLRKLYPSEVFSLLNSMLIIDDPKLRSRLRLILQTRMADDYVNDHFHLNTSHSMSDLVHSQHLHHFRTVPISEALENFRHEHYFYLQISLSQTQNELEGYLDDVNRFACLLGEEDGRDAGSQALVEYRIIKKWQAQCQAQAMLHSIPPIPAIDTSPRQPILQQAVTLPNSRKRVLEEVSPQIDYTRPLTKRRRHETPKPSRLMTIQSKPLTKASDADDQEPHKSNDLREQPSINRNLTRRSNQARQSASSRQSIGQSEPSSRDLRAVSPTNRTSSKSMSKETGAMQTLYDQDAIIGHYTRANYPALETRGRGTSNDDEVDSFERKCNGVQEGSDGSTQPEPRDSMTEVVHAFSNNDPSTKAEVVDTKPWLMTRGSKMDNADTNIAIKPNASHVVRDSASLDEKSNGQELALPRMRLTRANDTNLVKKATKLSESSEVESEEETVEEEESEEENKDEESEQDEESEPEQPMKKTTREMSSQIQHAIGLQLETIHGKRGEQRSPKSSDAGSNSTAQVLRNAQQEKTQTKSQLLQSSNVASPEDIWKSHSAVMKHKDSPTLDSEPNVKMSQAGSKSLRPSQHEILLPPGIYDNSENESDDESDDESSDSTSATPDMVTETLRILSQSRNAKNAKAKMEHLAIADAEKAKDQASYDSNSVLKSHETNKQSDKDESASQAGSTSSTTDYASDDIDSEEEENGKDSQTSTKPITPSTMLDTAAKALTTAAQALRPLDKPVTDKDMPSQSSTQNEFLKPAPSRVSAVPVKRTMPEVSQTASNATIQNNSVRTSPEQHAADQILDIKPTAVANDVKQNTAPQVSRGSPKNEPKKKLFKAAGPGSSVVKNRASKSVAKSSAPKSSAVKSSTAKASSSKTTYSRTASTPSRKQLPSKSSAKIPMKIREITKSKAGPTLEGLQFQDIKTENKT